MMAGTPLTIEVERKLDAPVEAVFDVLADPRSRPRWQRTCRWVEVEDDRAPGLGTRWRERAAGAGVHTLEICEFERPHHWAERMLDGRVRGELHVRLEPSTAGATRVLLGAELAPRGMARLLGPLLALAMRHEAPRDLDRLGREASRLTA